MVTTRGVKKNTSTWASTYVFKCQRQLVLGLLLRCFSRVWLCITLQTAAARLLCPLDSLGKNTGVGCHALFQGIPLNPGIKSGSALQADSFPLSPQGRPHLVLGILIQPQAGIWLLLSSPGTRRKNCLCLWYLISILLCHSTNHSCIPSPEVSASSTLSRAVNSDKKRTWAFLFSTRNREPLTVAHRCQMLSLGAQHRLSVIFSNYLSFQLNSLL